MTMATTAGPMALTWDGYAWTHWCSAYCAAFQRHVDSAQTTIEVPDGGKVTTSWIGR